MRPGLPVPRVLGHAPAPVDGRWAAWRLRGRRRGRLSPRQARGERGAAGRTAPRERRAACLALILLAALAVPAAPGLAFDLDDVAERAEAQARRAFRDPSGEVPDWLLEISYDQWRDIRFRPDRALWRDRKLPFQVQFFHPGPLLRPHRQGERRRRQGRAAASPFSPEPLRLRASNDFAQPRPAGPRLRRLPHPLPDQEAGLPRRGDRLPRRELLPRRRHATTCYGLSARGLAIDTALAVGRGVPLLPRVLARAAGAGRATSSIALRAARQPAPDGRLPLRGRTRATQTRGRRRGAPLLPRARSRSSASRR